jgi:hypothetical protein
VAEQRLTYDASLSDHELGELGDALAMTLHNLMGNHVFQLQRQDVAALIDSYVCDLADDEREAVVWIVWHLFQNAREIVTYEQEQRFWKRLGRR